MMNQFRGHCVRTFCWLAIAFLVAGTANAQRVIFSEDFEGLPLGPAVDEVVNDNMQDEVYSPDGPEGWTVDRSQVPDGGILEFRGWNFLSPAWWEEVAGNQERAGFVITGESVVAVADGDEWDDATHDPGNETSFMTTPPISVDSGDVDLTFDSSWRPDGTQEGRVRALFDSGEPVTLLHWFSSEDAAVEAGFDGPLSDDGLFGFRTDPIADGVPADEIIDATIPVPSGASTVQLEFGYINAGNNWWWAVDNISVGEDYFEDFEGVELGPNQDEDRAPLEFVGETATVWTNTAPEGWVIDNSGVPGVDLEFPDPNNDGVTEWAGWSFANKDWWTLVAGDQSRSSYASGEGTVLVADPDEWDDAGHPDSEENGWYQTTIDTPDISLEGVTEDDEVMIRFDSSWRPEFDNNFRQSGRLVATFSDGTEAEIFEWQSSDGDNTSEFLEGSDTVANVYENGAKLNDEDLTFPVPVPGGATSVSFQFEMFDAGNDWWWAIDNVELLVDGAASSCPLGDIDGDCSVSFLDFLILAQNFGNDVPAGTLGDLDNNGDVSFLDFLALAQNFGASGAEAAASVPEPNGFVLAFFALAAVGLVRRRR